MNAPWVKPMPVLIMDLDHAESLISRRNEFGHDRADEIWDGVYVIPPIRDNDHQRIVGGIATIVMSVLDGTREHRIYAGINVSDDEVDWLQNLRTPDVAVYLSGNPACDCDTHYCGGPDLAVEVITPGDRTHEKFDFYAKVHTRELLLVDRDPWALELYALRDGKFVLAGKSTPADSTKLASTTLPVTLRLLPCESRAKIEVRQTNGDLVRLV